MNKIEMTIKNYEKLAKEYYKNHNDISNIKEFIEFFAKNIKGNKILDIGCGPGRDANYFHKMGFNVTGIDLTSNFIKMASENFSEITFKIKDMRTLTDFPENYYDGLWVNASFLHIPKEEGKKTLSGFNRILKNNGIIYISVKEGNEEKIISKEEYKGGKKFFAFYEEEEIVKIIESCNFKVLKIITTETKKDKWLNIFAIKK